MISTPIKLKIIEALKQRQKALRLSGVKFSRKIGINDAQWSRLKKGETENLLADSKFITIAREQGIQLGSQIEIKTARTPAFEYIYSLLEKCQEQSISTLFVDIADLGKTHTAKYYVRNNPNAVYIDCSQVKTKQLFIREIARQFGVSHTGRYAEVYKDLVFYLNTLSQTLIILDEAGDLKYEAFLESKALWNATDENVGWFMMGADGLKEKMRRAIDSKKVGYTEMFRRYGKDYRQVTPTDKKELEKFLFKQVGMVIKANADKNTDVQKLIKASRNSLTNARNLIRLTR